MWQVNREKKRRKNFLCDNDDGGDRESDSSCNALWNVLVMEKGRNSLWILTVLVADLLWLVIGATRKKKVLSRTQCSHWNSHLLLYHCRWDKRVDINKLGNGWPEWQKNTEFWCQMRLELTTDRKIDKVRSNNRRKGGADDEHSDRGKVFCHKFN